MDRKDVLLVNPHNNPVLLKAERELKGYNIVDEQQLSNGAVLLVAAVLFCHKVEETIEMIAELKSRYFLDIIVIVDFRTTVAQASDLFKAGNIKILPSNFKDGDVINALEEIVNYPQFNKSKEKDYLMRGLTDNVPRALAIININSFRSINAKFGLKFGDFVSESVLSRIKLSRPHEGIYVYRTQIDEYAVLCTKKSSDFDITLYIKFLIQSLQDAPYIFNDKRTFITVASGVTDFTYEPNIFENTARALAQAKVMNKEIVFFTHNRLTCEDELETFKLIKESIANGGLYVQFQPIVANSSGVVDRFEALVRLNTSKGIISPLDFIPIAKKFNIYNQITKEVLTRSIGFAQLYNKRVSVNLTFDDLDNKETSEFIVLALENSGLIGLIDFELTESESLKDYEVVSRFIRKVKTFGSKILIDDFGSGYSNFVALIKLEIDVVKIEGSLIKDIMIDKTSLTVVQHLSDMFNKLGITIVAEYVEDINIFKTIKEMGIQYSQGYHFSKPLHHKEVYDYLKEGEGNHDNK